MSEEKTVAHGLFGPGIFATGIDLSALDSDTAFQLGGFMAEEILAAERRGQERAVQALQDWPIAELATELRDLSYAGTVLPAGQAIHLAKFVRQFAIDRLQAKGSGR